MAVRLMTYIGLLYQELLKLGELTPDGRLPLVIPLVLYNGKAAWWAPEELAELIERVDESAVPYVPRLRYLVVDESRPVERSRGWRNVWKTCSSTDPARWLADAPFFKRSAGAPPMAIWDRPRC